MKGQEHAPSALELIGAPTDVGASVRSTGMGPDALRLPGLRHLDEVVAWNRSVYDAVDAALGTGHVPLMLGGDHCPISAVARHVRQHKQKLRVLWLDAHTDVNTGATRRPRWRWN